MLLWQMLRCPRTPLRLRRKITIFDLFYLFGRNHKLSEATAQTDQRFPSEPARVLRNVNPINYVPTDRVFCEYILSSSVSRGSVREGKINLVRTFLLRVP